MLISSFDYIFLQKTEPEGEKKMKKWMTEAAGVLSQVIMKSVSVTLNIFFHECSNMEVIDYR